MARFLDFRDYNGTHYTKPPSPIGLIKKVTPGADPAARAREAGALADDAPIVPKVLRIGGANTTDTLSQKWEIARFFHDQSMGVNSDPEDPATWDYDVNDEGYLYQNLAKKPVPMVSSSTDTSPAPISVSPTSTTNWRRPRTVAAGWAARSSNGDIGTLTVVFRDGTMYNYYDINLNTWRNFRNAYSKGRYIRLYLNERRRGPARFTGVPEEYREAMYRLARTAQYQSATGGGRNEVGAIQDPTTTTRPQSFGSRRYKQALQQPRYSNPNTRPY